MLVTSGQALKNAAQIQFVGSEWTVLTLMRGGKTYQFEECDFASQAIALINLPRRIYELNIYILRLRPLPANKQILLARI
jgi:hypothetical protein